MDLCSVRRAASPLLERLVLFHHTVGLAQFQTAHEGAGENAEGLSKGGAQQREALASGAGCLLEETEG